MLAEDTVRRDGWKKREKKKENVPTVETFLHLLENYDFPRYYFSVGINLWKGLLFNLQLLKTRRIAYFCSQKIERFNYKVYTFSDNTFVFLT